MRNRVLIGVILVTFAACVQPTSAEPSPTLSTPPIPPVSLAPTSPATPQVPSPTASPVPLATLTFVSRPPEAPTLEPGAPATLSPDQSSALDAALEFFYRYDEVDRYPDKHLGDLAEITDGEMRQIMTALMAKVRERGIYREGRQKVFFLHASHPRELEGELQVYLELCTDNTGIRAIKVGTKDLEPDSERISHQLWKLLAARREGWKIIDGATEEIATCLEN